MKIHRKFTSGYLLCDQASLTGCKIFNTTNSPIKPQTTDKHVRQTRLELRQSNILNG
jgi:hypothetical protein